MWTRSELIEIRNRARLESSIPGLTQEWIHSCLSLASAADRLDAITSRIEAGEETAISPKPQLANEV